MRIGVLCEGAIDFELVCALLHRIAQVDGGISWPLQPNDTVEELRVRKGGHGQIPKALKCLLSVMEQEEWRAYSLFAVVLDERSGGSLKKIRRLIRGRPKFVIGVAIREIEAWWLADREETLRWLGLEEETGARTKRDSEVHYMKECRYSQAKYNPERDDSPKTTLDELTRQSPRLDRVYGDGNLELARDFASTWKNCADLAQMVVNCPRGFRPFREGTTEAMRRPVRNP